LAERVQRYRVFAESSSNILSAGGDSGGDNGGGGGSSDSGIQYVEAPLDWQVSALMRRLLRDTDMVDGSANVRTIVQDAFERQRKIPETATNAPKKHRSKNAAVIIMKAPWDKVWTRAAETGKYYVKMIKQDGTEINATRKANTIALADLLPTFPDTPVRPGSTWETKMSILGELSARTPINVRAPITFTAFESLVTPNGDNVRCAKLESRFRFPEDQGKKISVGLENQSGRKAGNDTTASTAAVPGAAAGAGGDSGALTVDDIDVARTDVARVLWFDIANRHIIRSEDSIRTYYETSVEADDAPATTDAGAGAAGGAGGAGDAGPKKVSYDLKVTTWLDDRIPPPTTTFRAGAGTAHARDNVTDPSIAPLMQTK
jgi:hypothetical protein